MNHEKPSLTNLTSSTLQLLDSEQVRISKTEMAEKFLKYIKQVLQKQGIFTKKFKIIK